MGNFTMPSLGADMEAGILVEWKIKPGDQVARGDIVAVVETQKGAIDIEVFEEGRVEALLVEPGTSVPVGTVLARIEGAAVATPPAHPEPTAAPLVGEPTAAPGSTPLRTAAGERVRASPAARAAARELGIDLTRIHGTGPGGAITRGDIESASASARAGSSPRSGMRQAIAAAMSRSKREIPHYYLSTHIDLTRALDWLRLHNQALKPAQRVLPVVMLLKAVARASQAIPEMNGYYESGAFRPSAAVHVGVAISLREGGLVVPALHDVASKSIDVLGSELADLIERARRGQLRSSELTDATLTVTSLGERGVEAVFGVIFPPQVAVVGFGKIVETPTVVDGACVPRPGVTATVAADHRVSDGLRGALFLAEMDRLLQDAGSL